MPDRNRGRDGTGGPLDGNDGRDGTGGSDGGPADGSGGTCGDAGTGDNDGTAGLNGAGRWEGRGAVGDLLDGLRTWAGLSVERRADGSRTLTLGAREVGRVHDDGSLDVTLPEPTREYLVEADRTTPYRVDSAAGRASYYLPDHPVAGDRDADPATVEDGLRLLRVAYLGHALSLSHTGPGGEVLASIDVEPELRALDLDPETAGALDELRNR